MATYIPVLVRATAAQTLATTAMLMLTGIAPIASVSLGIPAHWVGYQISLSYLLAISASLVAGELISRYGGARVEALALLLQCCAFASASFGNIWSIVLATLLAGFGYGLTNPSASDLLIRSTPLKRRYLVFSIKQTGVPLGGVLASVVIPMVAQHSGWHLALGFFSPMALAIFVYSLRADSLNQPIKLPARKPFIMGIAENHRSIFGSTKLSTLAFIGFAYSAIQLSLSSYTVVMLIEEYHWSLLAAGGVAGTMQFVGASSRIFWGVIAGKIGNGYKTLAILGLSMCLVCFGALFLGGASGSLQATWFVGLGFLAMGWNGVMIAEVSRAAGPSVGDTTAAVMVYNFWGVILGPSTFALLYTATGHYAYTFVVLSVLPLLGGLLSLRTARI